MIMRTLGVYIIALLAGGVVLAVSYVWLCPHEAPSRRRFAARLVAGPLAMLTFVGIFHALGAASVLDPTGAGRTWREDIPFAIGLGFLYAVLWPLANWLRPMNRTKLPDDR